VCVCVCVPCRPSALTEGSASGSSPANKNSSSGCQPAGAVGAKEFTRRGEETRKTDVDARVHQRYRFASLGPSWLRAARQTQTRAHQRSVTPEMKEPGAPDSYCLLWVHRHGVPIAPCRTTSEWNHLTNYSGARIKKNLSVAYWVTEREREREKGCRRRHRPPENKPFQFSIIPSV